MGWVPGHTRGNVIMDYSRFFSQGAQRKTASDIRQYSKYHLHVEFLVRHCWWDVTDVQFYRTFKIMWFKCIVNSSFIPRKKDGWSSYDSLTYAIEWFSFFRALWVYICGLLINVICLFCVYTLPILVFASVRETNTHPLSVNMNPGQPNPDLFLIKNINLTLR